VYSLHFTIKFHLHITPPFLLAELAGDPADPQRVAGLRSAQVLTEFARACQIPIFETGLPETTLNTSPNIAVPMFRSLARRQSAVDPATEFSRTAGESTIDVASLEAWLGVATTDEPVLPAW
jgi:hypothetical protein